MSNALQKIDEVPMISATLVMQIARRMFAIYKQPWKDQNKISQDEFPAIAERVIAMGVINPLDIGGEYHLWKDRGDIVITRHYGPILNWSREKYGNFRIIQIELDQEEVEKLGTVSPGDFVTMTALVLPGEEEKYKERFSLIFQALLSNDYDVAKAERMADISAMRQVGFGYGICSKDEVWEKETDVEKAKVNPLRIKNGAAIKGWLPGTSRSQVRSLKEAIRHKFGTPSSREMAQLGIKRYSGNLTQADLLELATADEIVIEAPEVQERLLALKAQQAKIEDEAKERENNGTYKENLKTNADLIRGEAEEGIGMDYEVFDATLPDYVKEINSIGDLKAAMDIAGIKSAQEQNNILRMFFSGKKFSDLSSENLAIIVEYTKRKAVIEDLEDFVSQDAKRLVRRIPEFADLADAELPIDRQSALLIINDIFFDAVKHHMPPIVWDQEADWLVSEALELSGGHNA